MANAQTIQLHLKAIGDFSDVTGDISQVQQMLSKLKLPANMTKNFQGIFEELTRETTKYQRLLDGGFKKKGDVTGLEASGKRISSLLTKLQGEMRKIDPEILKQSFKIDPSAIDNMTKKMRTLQSQLSTKLNSDGFKKLKTDADSAATAMSKISKTKFTANFTEAFNRGDIKGAAEAISQLEANHKQFNSTAQESAFAMIIAEMKQALAGLAGDTELQNITTQIRQLDTQMDQLDAEELERFVQTFQQGQNSVDGMTNEIREFTAQTNQAAQSQMSFSSQLDQLKSQVTYFFGMTNAVYLLRSALTKALNTVKELDAVMTQTAVVTDLSVGDMWEKLPEYAANANKLGVAMKDLYSATTLYYQQGLKGNAVMEVGVETMKMAAIAGMEAEEATQAMTAALRGFNMEVTETNAQRINDVYSKLAAITASDTGQIATAMSKTASIAASANMEFENTAALLAQIIETTQEAPETAGTAVKTIIARFSEVKALREKGKSSGEDEEGEIIDVNKIDKALKSVGISMSAYFSGTEGLDDVLLRLSEKWSTLDFKTQRYIATMAAGSRQQSRFIAMMSNYQRTMELTDAAVNSSGASQEQWAKTTESIEYKLNRLKNSWDEFTMSIANSSLIKGAVDLLVNILDTINKLTDKMPGFTKGIANIALVFGALQVGGKVINALFTSLAARFSAGGKAAGVSFRKALAQEFAGVKTLFSKQAWRMPKIDTKAQQASLAKLAAAQKAAAASAAGTTAATTTEAAASTGAVGANEAYAAALTEVGVAHGFSASQQSLFNTMVMGGISADVAAAAAANGMTAATYNQMVAQAAAASTTEEEARAKLELMLATYNSMAAKNAENTVDSLSLTQKMALWGAILFGNKAKKQEALASLQAAAAKGVETGATWALTIAEYAACIPAGIILLIILAIIAAVVLLVVAIASLIKKAKNSTPEAKMKKLREEADAAAESAQKAKEAYDAVMDDRNSYEEAQKAVEDLTRGTTEWKEALLEANEQVLELIKKYPQLAEYMTMGENGAWQISDEGWDQLTSVMNERVENTRVVAALKQQDIAEGNYNNYSKKSQVSMSDGSTYESDKGYLTGSEAKALVAELNELTPAELKRSTSTTDSSGYAYTKDGISYMSADGYTKNDDGTYNTYSQKFKDLAAKYNMTAEDLYNNLEGINTYAREHNAQMRAIIASAASIELQGSKYYQGITEGLANTMDVDAIQEKHEDEWGKTGKNENYRNGKNTTTDAMNAKIDEYNKNHPGAQIEKTGNEDEDMAAYYEALSGEEYDIEENGKDSDNELADKIADLEAAQEIQSVTDELYNASVEYREIGQVFSGDLDAGRDLETGEYGDLSDIQGVAKTAGLSDEALAALENQYQEIEAQREDIDREIAAIFGEDYEAQIGVNITGSYANADSFLKTYEEFATKAGEGAAVLFADLIKDVDSEAVPGLIKEFEDIDWSSPIQGAAALKDMIINGSEATSDFALKMVALAPALYSVTSQVNELYGIIGEEALAEMAKDGEITATEMLELSDSCEELGIVMDTTGVSANTLASYYEKLEDGTLDMVSASQNFIAVLEKLNAASGTIENSFAFLDTFEVERSYTDIGAGFAEMQGAMKELYDKGAYSDAQLIDYVKQFVGEENWGDLVKEKGGDMKAAMDEVMNSLPQNGDNMYQMWKQFAETDSSGMTSVDETGGISFDMTAIGSVDQLKQQLMSTMGISEVLADAMIADAQTFTSNLGQQLQNLSIQDALSEWINGAVDFNGKKIISEKELQAFAKDAGLDPDELRKQLESEEIGIDIDVVPYLNEDGTLSDVIREQMIDQFKETGVFDLDQAYQMLLEIGLDDAAAKEELKRMGKSLTNMPVTANGEDLGMLGENMEITAEDGTKYGTLNGVVEGLEDPAVAAAQDLAALEQGQMTSNAMATGMVVAINSPMIALASGLDGIINGLIDKVNQIPGVNISKTNLTGKMKSAMDGQLAIAEAAVGEHYSGKIKEAEETLAAKKEEAAAAQAAADAAAQTIAEGLDVNAANASSYTSENQQTEAETEEEEEDEGDPWENSYDRYYNVVQDINAELRERERLEKEYQRLLEKTNSSAKDLVKNKEAQLASLDEERHKREWLKEKRVKSMGDIEDEYSQYSDYAWFDETSGTVQIDWTKIDSLEGSTDEEFTSGLEEFITKLEEGQDLIEEQEDALEEIEDTVKDIYNEGQDDYFDLENQIMDALFNSYQKEIDKLSDINDSINDTNDDLLDAIQKAIDEERQARENEETEEELRNKAQRIQYLSQDTSGANALEILQLQEELEDEQRSYTDTLIDQKISKLQEQNDLAAEQRDRQITVAEDQLQFAKDNGLLWNRVYQLMQTGIDEQGKIKNGSELFELLKNDQDYASLSNLQGEQWVIDLHTMTKSALAYMEVGRSTRALWEQGRLKTDEAIRFKYEDNWIDGTVDAEGYVTAKGKQYTDVHQTWGGDWVSNGQAPRETPKTYEDPVEPPEGSSGGDSPDHDYEFPQWIKDYISKPANDGIVTTDADTRAMVGTYTSLAGHQYAGTTEDRDNQLVGLNTENWGKVVGKYDNAGTFWAYPPAQPYHEQLKKYTGNKAYQDAYAGAIAVQDKVSGKYHMAWVKRGDSDYPWPASGVKRNEKEINGMTYQALLGQKEGPYKKYKTGGLADFTGPAWLDGTKAKPEYVLNAEQTRAFFTLVDVLSGLKNMSQINSSTEKHGDNVYDIDINVESIGDDYSVEQMAEQIKRLISEHASYRNNNTIGTTR